MFDYSLNGVTICVVRDTRRKNIADPCPVKWRVTYQRKQVYYSTGINLLLNEWESLPTTKNSKLSDTRKTLQKYFDEVLQKQIKELAESDNFTFDALNARLGKTVGNTVCAAFQAKIDTLKESGSIGNANVYQFALNSFKTFAGDKMLFSSITPEWLQRYQAHMEEKHLRWASIGMHMRTLRAIVNDALRQNIMKLSAYPFGRGKYEIPAGGGRELALTIENIRQIAAFECPTNTLSMCRDLWLFSFYCNGINFGDMCRLRYSNIENGEIVFYRKKTLNTSSVKKEIKAPVLPPMQVIIDRWGNPSDMKKSFIFPYLNGCKTEVESKLEINNIVRLVNKQIKRVTKALELPDISTYNARHSYATILAKMRVPESYIADALGHSNRTVTQSYFGNYTKEERLTYNSMLL